MNDPIYEKGKTVEHYTPPYILDLVKQTFAPDGIELDPCSSIIANSYVQAQRYFTKKEDALTREWVAKTVFLNPPYGRQVGEFIKHLIFSLEMKTVNEAILLINSNTSTGYWQYAYQHCSAVSFPNHRIAFIDVDGKIQKSPRYSNTIFYFGEHHFTFLRFFKTLGVVAIV